MQDYSVIFIIVNSCLLYKIFRCKKVHTLLKILLGVSYFGWNAVPAILMSFPAISEVTSTTPLYVFCSYVNQTFLFLTYLIAYILIKRRPVPSFIKMRDFQNSKRLLNLFVNVAFILALYKILTLLTNTFSYLESNDLENATVGGPIDFLGGFSMSFITGTIFFFRKKVSFAKFYLCVSIMVFYWLILTFRGGRIYIFGIVILLLYYALIKRSKTILILGLLTGLFALTLLPALASLRGSDNVNTVEVINESKSSSSEMVVEQILGKTNSVNSGSYLIQYDGIGNNGYMMYTSTIYALIPRIIYPSKPEPGSVDGTLTGLPSRRAAIYQITGEYDGVYNLGVSTSLSSLWGGGWLMYFVEIFSSAFLIFLLNSVFRSRKMIYITFAMSLLNYPICVLEIPLPTILISVQRFTVIYFILSFICHKPTKTNLRYKRKHIH